MNLKRALMTSLILHGGILAFLLAGVDWSFYKPKKNLLPIEAHMLIKDKARSKELLPKKPLAPVLEETKVIEPKKLVEKPIATKADKPVPVAKNLATKEVSKKKPAEDYKKKLQSLSQSFAADLAKEVVNEPEEAAEVDDHSYFDQVYTLIKKSFIVPPHINGPHGQRLQAVVRLFLGADGNLAKLDLETSSGDEHFDQAVMDGAKRVSNFGAVPIFLQSALRERGLVVELCPFKCVER